MDRRVGIVTNDPATGAAVGVSLDIAFMHYFPVIPKGAGDLHEWDHFGTALIALSFEANGELRTDGSAVLIGPGLALAAKHVLDPVMSDLLAGRISVTAFSITEHSAIIWRVRQVVMHEHDVVILRLDLACDFPSQGLRVATLTTRLPAVGEPIMVVGFRGSETASINDEIELQVRVGVGEVSSVFLDGRDRVMLPHPCIEVRCLTVGGMSGGPAFDKNGNLIGVLSTSFEQDEGPSYVSLWFPVAVAPIQSCWPPGIVPLPTSLLGMSAKRMVAIIKPEALNLMEGDRLAYRAWSDGQTP